VHENRRAAGGASYFLRLHAATPPVVAVEPGSALRHPDANPEPCRAFRSTAATSGLGRRTGCPRRFGSALRPMSCKFSAEPEPLNLVRTHGRRGPRSGVESRGFGFRPPSLTLDRRNAARLQREDNR